MADKKPIIFSVDDDAQVLRAVRRDLRSEYKEDYRIVSTESANDALETLKELKKKGEDVALFLSDQRMPEMLGVDFLAKAQEFYPEAKQVLLTAYSDTDAAIKGINDAKLDYYLIKPWDPPEEKMFPVLNDLLDEWHITHRSVFQGIRVIGFQYSPKSHAIKDFLAGNLRPYQWLDIDRDKEAEELAALHDLEKKDMPVVTFEDGTCMHDPTLADLAKKVGLNAEAKSDLYDVVIVGAGPAGLAAGVYGGSEGLKTLIIEANRPGGQAGTSSRIENYLGFPKGLSGSDLTRRALSQAQRFGIEFLSPQEVNRINPEGNLKIVELKDGSSVKTKAVVIATGVQYRKLNAPGVENFTGRGVYYGAAMTEANACRDQIVYIVGGGNSAGQGAVYLSKYAKEVKILIRKPDLTSSMSSYLIDQIDSIDNIEVLGSKEVKEVFGEDHIEALNLADSNQPDNCEKVPADALFIFIGAKPSTDWIGKSMYRDEKGYLETGRDLTRHKLFKKGWRIEREPFLLETCVPGVFAAGDVRSGAMNRVASAVGEGAMAIKFVHEYLGTI